MYLKYGLWFLITSLFFSILTFMVKAKMDGPEILVFEQPKPYVPDPILIKKESELSHPWLQKQPWISKITTEIAKDMALCDEITQEIARQHPQSSKQQVAHYLIQTLTDLQKKIPFSVPDGYYNVLCIPEESKSYQIYQRVFLGDTLLGLPFYLDIRAYPVQNEEEALRLLNLNYKDFQLGNARILKCKKNINVHGLESYEEERAVFLFPIIQENILYIAYAEAAWTLFQKYLNYFEKIEKKL